MLTTRLHGYTVECQCSRLLQCVHKTAECRRNSVCTHIYTHTHTSNVDSECVSIQWFVCSFCFFFFSCSIFSSDGVRLFEFSSVSVRIYELCVHTHFTLSRVKTSSERNSRKKDRKRVLPLTANHRRTQTRLERKKINCVYFHSSAKVHHLFCMYFVYI